MNDLKSIKEAYQMCKSKGEDHRNDFLDGVVGQCKYLGFNEDKTMMMLGLVRNFLPEPGQKFTECDGGDEFDNKYTKKVLDMFEVSQ